MKTSFNISLVKIESCTIFYMLFGKIGSGIPKFFFKTHIQGTWDMNNFNQFPKMDILQYTFSWVGEHRLVTPSITAPKQPKDPP